VSKSPKKTLFVSTLVRPCPGYWLRLGYDWLRSEDTSRAAKDTDGNAQTAHLPAARRPRLRPEIVVTVVTDVRFPAVIAFPGDDG
jgi:hypothetical protein